MTATREDVLRELLGGLWHTTSADRFREIRQSGAILPDPDIPDEKRWNSFVRTIGGVSLFDFDGFDPEKYRKKYPTHQWWVFVPCQHGWSACVWIEIDRQAVASRIISSKELEERQKASGKNVWLRRFAEIEVAHDGPLPRTAFKRAFLVREGDSRLQVVDC